MNVMLDESGIHTRTDTPAACAELWWGKRLRAVHVDLSRIDANALGELLADAWEHKAPKKLVETATRQ